MQSQQSWLRLESGATERPGARAGEQCLSYIQQSPEPVLQRRDAHRLSTHTTKPHTHSPRLMLVSLYHAFPPRSDVVVVGGSGAEGAQALLSPLELTEQPPALPLKPPAGESLIPMVPCLAH